MSVTVQREARLGRQLLTRVVGVTFRGPDYPRSLHLLADILGFADKARWDDGVRPLLKPEFRQHIDQALVHGQLPMRLVREPDNPVDPLAVQVWPTSVEIGQLGYLPATKYGCVAHPIARSLDRGERWEAWLSRVRIHREHPENPGLDVTLRRRSAS